MCGCTITFFCPCRDICKKVKESIAADTSGPKLSVHLPASKDYIVHYSFDYAQQVINYHLDYNLQ